MDLPLTMQDKKNEHQPLELQQITDNSVIALPNECLNFTNVNFRNCWHILQLLQITKI